MQEFKKSKLEIRKAKDAKCWLFLPFGLVAFHLQQLVLVRDELICSE